SHDSTLIILLFFFLILRPPPTSTLFPYTTLFRSRTAAAGGRALHHRRRKSQLAADDQRQHDQWNCRAGPGGRAKLVGPPADDQRDRKSTRLNSSHVAISYAVFCLKKKKQNKQSTY